jgi:O-antigen/teichoic acid export membrane protein
MARELTFRTGLGSFQIFGSAVVLSSASFIVNIVVSRTLDVERAAQTLVLLSGSALAVQLVQSPIETYGPLLRKRLIDTKDERLNFKVHVAGYLATTFLALTLLLVVTDVFARIVSLKLLASFLLLLFCQSIFVWRRADLVSHQEFGPILVRACITAGTSSCACGLLYLVNNQVSELLILGLALSYLAGGFAFKFQVDVKLVRLVQILKTSGRVLKSQDFIQSIGSLMITNAFNLLLINGTPLVVASLIPSPREVVSTTTLISLTSIPALVTYSVVSPVMHRFIRLRGEQRFNDLRQFYNQLLVASLFYSVVCSLLFKTFGNSFVTWIVGPQYKTKESEILLVALSVVIGAASFLPRVILVILGEIKLLYVAMFLAFLVYCATLRLSAESVTSVSISSLLASSTVILMSSLVVWKRLSIIGIKFEEDNTK